MNSFKILYAPEISPQISNFGYLSNALRDLGVVDDVVTHNCKCDNEGFATGYAYTVKMESWSKEGEKVREMIEKGDYLYNAGTEQRPLYFAFCV